MHLIWVARYLAGYQPVNFLQVFTLIPIQM